MLSATATAGRAAEVGVGSPSPDGIPLRANQCRRSVAAAVQGKGRSTSTRSPRGAWLDAPVFRSQMGESICESVSERLSSSQLSRKHSTDSFFPWRTPRHTSGLRSRAQHSGPGRLGRREFPRQDGNDPVRRRPDGGGKTTLFRTVLKLVPHSGTTTWKVPMKMGYVRGAMESEVVA